MTNLQLVTAATSIATLRGGARQRFAKASPPPLPTKASSPSKTVDISQKWFALPEIARFFVSGNLGNLCFFLLEKLVHRALCEIPSPSPFVDGHKDTISFFVAYILQIVTQHFLHALLVYGLETIDTQEKYFGTLLGQTGAYLIAMFGSTFLNAILRKWGLSKTKAFVTTLYIFAIINFFVVGWIVRRAVRVSNEHQNATNKNGSSKRAATDRLEVRGGADLSLSRTHCFPQHFCADDARCTCLGAFVLSTCQPVHVTYHDRMRTGMVR